MRCWEFDTTSATYDIFTRNLDSQWYSFHINCYGFFKCWATFKLAAPWIYSLENCRRVLVKNISLWNFGYRIDLYIWTTHIQTQIFISNVPTGICVHFQITCLIVYFDRLPLTQWCNPQIHANAAHTILYNTNEVKWSESGKISNL